VWRGRILHINVPHPPSIPENKANLELLPDTSIREGKKWTDVVQCAAGDSKQNTRKINERIFALPNYSESCILFYRSYDREISFV